MSNGTRKGYSWRRIDRDVERFLYAGSKRIIASLWKVDDAATAEFMKRFYKNHITKGLPASKALQQTKIEMRKIFTLLIAVLLECVYSSR